MINIALETTTVKLLCDGQTYRVKKVSSDNLYVKVYSKSLWIHADQIVRSATDASCR